MDLGNREDRLIFFGLIAGVLAVVFLHMVFELSIFLSIVIVVIGVVAIIGGLIFLAEQQNKKEEKEAFKKAHPHYEAEEFYRACCKAGVRSAKTEADIAKISECANEQFLRMTQQEALDFFLLGQAEVQRIKDEEQQAFLAKLTEEETEYEKYITRFASFAAHRKVAAMCSERAMERRELLKYLQDHVSDGARSATNLYTMSKRKEYDWATMGGIASGLGGFGAGVAVAVDAQIKNQEIRQQNQQLESAINSMAVVAINNNIEEQTRVKGEMEYWERQAMNASKLKVKEAPAEELLAILSPSVAQKAQNKTGSMVIKVKIEPYYSRNLMIGKNRAVIDGTIKAVFWKENTRVGEAVLTLPLNNNGYREAVLEGICRSDLLEYKERYTITFEPNALWLIEELYWV